MKTKFQKSGSSPDSALDFSNWHMNLNYMYFFLSTRRNGKKKACKLEVLNSCKMLYILMNWCFWLNLCVWKEVTRRSVDTNHTGSQLQGVTNTNKFMCKCPCTPTAYVPISVTIKLTLTCRMGSKPNLSIKWSVNIDTMINFDGDGDGHGHGDDTCRRALKYPVIINTQPVYVRVKI